MTMFRPLISAKVRSTARRSAPWKSRLIGWPVNCRPRDAAVQLIGRRRRGWRLRLLRCDEPRDRRVLGRVRIRLRHRRETTTGDDEAEGPPAPVSRPRAAIGSAAGSCRSAIMASDAGPVVLVAGGSAYGAALADGLSKSMTMVLRSLRTWWATGCDSAMRTRDAGRAERFGRLDGDRARSGSSRPPPTELATLGRRDVAEIEQQRQRIRPRRRVGHRLVRLDDERRALGVDARADRRQPDAAATPAGGADAFTSAPAAATVRSRAKPRFTVIPWRPRAIAAICELPAVLHERQRIVDFLNDDQPLRRDRS